MNLHARTKIKRASERAAMLFDDEIEGNTSAAFVSSKILYK